MSTIIICEKGSQAANVKAAIGNKYGEVYALRGHIFRIAHPEEVNPEWEKWNYDLLKPESRYPLKPDYSQGKKEIHERIKSALKSADTVILATDSDREGQAIGENVLREYKFSGKVLRAKFNSEDKPTLQAAFDNLHDNSGIEFARLYESAMARSEIDQITNLSMTRAATSALGTMNKKAIGIGRVKTPTLAIVCAREQQILNFKPQDYYDISLSVQDESGAAVTLLHSPNPKITEKTAAKEIIDGLRDFTGNLSVTVDDKSKAPAKPYHLSSLTKAAKLSAAKTLEIVQTLYSEHKIVSYPRTASRYLPEVEIDNAAEMKAAIESLPLFESTNAEPVIRKGKAGTFSDAGLSGSSHHAIIPNLKTRDEWANALEKLSPQEAAVFKLICTGYLASIYPDYEYQETVMTVLVDDREYRVKGIIEIKPGWKVLHQDKNKAADDEPALPNLKNGQLVSATNAELLTKTTRPPKRIAESDLSVVMENAWKFAKDKDAQERLKMSEGIGTSATRASIIEGLIDQGFFEIRDKIVYPTDHAMQLFRLLLEKAPEALDPITTANLEFALDKIISGEAKAQAVIDQHCESVRAFLDKMRALGEQRRESKGQEPPSVKHIKFATTLSKDIGYTINESDKASFNSLNHWIEKAKAYQSENGIEILPTAKQLRSAKKIARAKKIDLPNSLNRSQLSEWIDNNTGKRA